MLPLKCERTFANVLVKVTIVLGRKTGKVKEQKKVVVQGRTLPPIF